MLKTRVSRSLAYLGPTPRNIADSEYYLGVADHNGRSHATVVLGERDNGVFLSRSASNVKLQRRAYA